MAQRSMIFRVRKIEFDISLSHLPRPSGVSKIVVVGSDLPAFVGVWSERLGGSAQCLQRAFCDERNGRHVFEGIAQSPSPRGEASWQEDKGKRDSGSLKAIVNLLLAGNKEEGSDNDSEKVLDEKQDLGSLLTSKVAKGRSGMRLAPEADVIAKQLLKDIMQTFVVLYDRNRRDTRSNAEVVSLRKVLQARANFARTLSTRRNLIKNMLIKNILIGYQALPVHLETRSSIRIDSLGGDADPPGETRPCRNFLDVRGQCGRQASQGGVTVRGSLPGICGGRAKPGIISEPSHCGTSDENDCRARRSIGEEG